MFEVLEGAGVLLLLSVYFAYVLAPAVVAVRRLVRVGPHRRPVPTTTAVLMLYLLIAVPGALAWRGARAGIRHFVTVTAPATVDRLFQGGNVAPLAGVIDRSPLPGPVRRMTIAAGAHVAGSLDRQARRTLAACLAAAPYAGWLAVTPVIAFLLLTGAPTFQQSALRVIPHGHLQWRAGEYLRDVNSALAGYVRAQLAAGLIVGAACVAGFVLLRVPSAVSLGVTVGILETVSVIGPLTGLLVATAQAGPRLLPVLSFLVALRLVQDYVVYPRLIRRGMHLSTPTVILTIWCGAVLAEAAGVILAIPVAGCISVSLRHWREYRDIERLVAAGR